MSTQPHTRPDANDKFNVFTPANCATPVQERQRFFGQFTISIRKKGVLSFSKVLYTALRGSAETVKIQMLQDKEKPRDWYIKIVEDVGFEIKVCAKQGAKFSLYKFGNIKLCALLRTAFGLPDDIPFRVLVAREPITDKESPYFGMYPLLAGSAKEIVRKPRK